MFALIVDVSSLTLSLIITHLKVKDHYKERLEKQKSKHEAEIKSAEEKYQKKTQRWSDQLEKVKLKMMEEGQQLEYRLRKLDDELSSANDRIYLQKKRIRDLVQKQIDESYEVATQVQNYEDSFLEENKDLRAKLKKALSDKRAAERQSRKDKQLAQSILAKWH